MFYVLEISVHSMRYRFSSVYFCQISRVEFLVTKPNNILFFFPQVTSGIHEPHILEPSCEWLDNTENSPRRSLINKDPTNFLNTNLKLPLLSCRVMLLFHMFMQCNDNLTIYTFKYFVNLIFCFLSTLRVIHISLWVIGPMMIMFAKRYTYRRYIVYQSIYQNCFHVYIKIIISPCCLSKYTSIDTWQNFTPLFSIKNSPHSCEIARSLY